MATTKGTEFRGVTLTRIKVLTGYAAHARYLAEEPEDAKPLGQIPRQEHIREPYAYSPTHLVWNHNGVPVAIFETAHRRYEVYRVDGPLSPVDED